MQVSKEEKKEGNIEIDSNLLRKFWKIQGTLKNYFVWKDRTNFWSILRPYFETFLAFFSNINSKPLSDKSIFSS